jgi:hypothetical protein
MILLNSPRRPRGQNALGGHPTMQRNRFVRARAALLGLLLAAAGTTLAGPALGEAGLQRRHAAMQQQLANSPFRRPVVLESDEVGRRLEGDVYAVLDHPFAAVNAALTDQARWCAIMILHLNTKHCRHRTEGSSGVLEVRVGKKVEQPVHAATLLTFAWQTPVSSADYMQIQMLAGDGPFDTRDYRLLAEAVPLPGGRTFLHMGYAFSYSGASSLAMRLYLATIGHDKVGFTVVVPARDGAEPTYVGGMRGVVERNTMRYYLAIDAYLDSLQQPAGQQQEQRLRAWFDATEKFPRQLHEVEREAYLSMKRGEIARQAQNP